MTIVITLGNAAVRIDPVGSNGAYRVQLDIAGEHQPAQDYYAINEVDARRVGWNMAKHYAHNPSQNPV